MTRTTLILGTRGSALALTQSNWVAENIRAMLPKLEVELRIIKTTGDKVQDRPLSAIGDDGGKGLFVKEIEEAMLSGEIDIAVHSMKDMPAKIPDGLTLLAIPPREDCSDVLVFRNDESDKEYSIDDLPKGARV